MDEKRTWRRAGGKRGWKRRIEDKKPRDTVKTRVKGGRYRLLLQEDAGSGDRLATFTFYTSAGKKDKLLRQRRREEKRAKVTD